MIKLKKLIKLSLFLCLFVPLTIFANVKVSFDDAKWSSNTYITQFKNYRWYIDFNTKKKYGYNGSIFSEVSGFDRGGLINLNEYKISLEEGKSYLKTVRPYWTMTLNGSKIYSLNNGESSLLDRTSVSSGARPTEYVLHQAEVSGDGSYSNPWKFVKPEFYVDVEYNSPQIKRNGTGVKDTAVEYGDIITYSIGLKNNGVKDSVINIREVALISALNKLVKLKADSSDDFKLVIGNKTMSLAEAKAAANALLSDSGYSVTIAPGQEMTLEFNVVIIGNAGEVINNQLLYVMDGMEADPGVKNSMNIEKVVQYTEVAETGSNVVISLDDSSSMGTDYMNTAKNAAIKFADIMIGENANTNNRLCVVIMNQDSKCFEGTGASTLASVTSYISAITSSGTTPYDKALTASLNHLNSMKNDNPLNKNYLVFLSDGAPDSTTNYATQQADIKKIAEIYTIGFVNSVSVLEKLATNSTDALFSGGPYYYNATTADLSSVFESIAKRINEKSKRTTKGVLAISRNIDKTKNLIIEVTANGTTKEIIKSYTDALNESYIINKGSRYEINIKKFNAEDKISVTYFLEKN